MGYFSNGTEGEAYYDRWCTRCRHESPQDEVFCPVWYLHLADNYDAANDDASPLHVLIPRDEKGFNKRCAMFIARDERCPDTADLFA